MRIGKYLAIFAALTFAVGCSDATSDSETSHEGFQTVGETDGEGKGDNIRGKEIAWKSSEEIALEGTTHEGTAEIVTSDPKVRIRTSDILIDVEEYPVEINIESKGGLLNTQEMKFVAYHRQTPDEEWNQLKFTESYEVGTCVCSDFKCDSMAAAAPRCQGSTTKSSTYWYYGDMTVENDMVKFGRYTFNIPGLGQNGFQMRIVPLPYGSFGNMEEEYDYELSVECFGGECGSGDASTQ